VSQFLLLGSTAALALLVVHSWKTRGRAVTLAFFIAATLYGLLRENALWLLMQHLTGGESGVKPYIPQEGFLPEIGHAHLQVAMGWVFAMYLAWTISELILRRIPRFAGRVFMIAGLSSLFMLAICWCMETAAVAVGWWYWELPTRSALFGNVNTLGMEGWFTVVPDFLLPFLVIVCSDGLVGARHAVPALRAGESRARHGVPLLKWLWALAFPLHIGGHMMAKEAPQLLWVYHALEMLVVVPMMFSKLAMARGAIRADAPRYAAALPGAALAVFFGVITSALLMRGFGGKELMTQAPMLMLCLMAWGRVPWWLAAGISLAAAGGWAWLGPRALWALTPIAACGFLRLLGHLHEPVWLRVVPVALAAALSVVSIMARERERPQRGEFLRAWGEAERLHFEGKPAEAKAAYARADALRPDDIIDYHRVVKEMTMVPEGRVGASAARFVYRIPLIIREFEELARRDPEFYPPRRDLVLYFLLDGRLADAVKQYREIYAFRREDAKIASLYAWLLLRSGETTEAEAVLERLTQRRDPPPEALVNLGVVRFAQKRGEDAQRLWKRALEIDPGSVMARVNLERMRDASPDRSIDPRFLARDKDVADLAWWVNDLAFHAPGRTASERLRLWLEATQMKPDLVPAHANAASIYLDRSSGLYDARRAAWHAKRAVEGARESGKELDLVKTLLLLGCALAADGKPDEARRALEEGRAKAPPEAYPDFDRALRELM
jgi:tetratricopeptide (TPR) repeat protein